MSVRAGCAARMVAVVLGAASLAAAAADADVKTTAAVDPQALAAATTRLDAARALSRALRDAQDQSTGLEREGDSLAALAKRLTGDSSAEARGALSAAQACVAPLAAGLQQARDALQRALQTLDGAHRAVGDTVRAKPVALQAAKAAADEAFSARDAAERALMASDTAVQDLVLDCDRRHGVAARAVDDLETGRGSLATQAVALKTRLSDLQQGLAAAEAARRTSMALGAELPPLVLPPLPDTTALQRLVQALQPRASDGTLASANLSRPDVSARFGAYARLRDAATYVDLTAATARCPASSCQGGAKSRRALALRQADARAALDEALAEQQSTMPALQQALATQAASLAALTALFQRVAPDVVTARADVHSAAVQAVETIEPVMAAGTRELASAERAWQLAGGVPSSTGYAQAASSASPSPSFRIVATALASPPRAHAWTLFGTLATGPGTSRDAEPADFRAYTYVVVDGDALADDGVRRRFVTVVETVQGKASKATDVAAADRPQVNVFCFPARAGASSRPADILAGYDDDLGKALRLRAQTGLLARPEMRAVFLRSKGPFLLTLPRRAGESRSDTPLLLADLSSYPVAAISDLVESYMGDLLQRFPEDQAQWRPPTAMKVALTLVSWATGPVRVLSGLVPEAQARESGRR